MKACTKCGDTKPLDRFCNQPTGKHGKQASCKDCDNRKHKKRKFNITDKELDQLMEITICMGCGENLLLGSRGYKGHCIDHSHTTGKVRGVLCRECNLILGYAHDNPAILLNLIKYLNK